MMVAMFFLSDVKYGGFVSFTAHLRSAFTARNIKSAIFKIRKTTESKHRPFCAPHVYQNINIATALQALNSVRGLIVCCNWKKEGAHARTLLEQGVPIVIHDPTEVHPELVECILENDTQVITIRKSVKAYLLAEHGVESTFIPHPYTRADKQQSVAPGVRKCAASISRVDFDKHTEMIVEANLKLPYTKAVHIYGFINRIFAHHKLNAIDDDWMMHHHGTFDLSLDAGVRLARQYRYIVDMSAIKGDGGGTQYTFFEAWDAGSVLVLNKAWLTKRDKHNVIQPGENALVVGSADELVDVLTSKKRKELNKVLIQNGRRVLKKHGPLKVVGAYRKILA